MAIANYNSDPVSSQRAPVHQFTLSDSKSYLLLNTKDSKLATFSKDYNIKQAYSASDLNLRRNSTLTE
jgi:hypothetical protein